MMKKTVEQKIYYTLRIVIAMCFIGHGAFGIITKPIWCNYFAVFGIHEQLAYRLMPWVGSFDIILGILMLARPMRFIPLWLMGWGLITASLRPLSGEPIAELIERAGNFGAPMALLILCGGLPKNIRDFFGNLRPPALLNELSFKQTIFCLQIVGFLLLAGHGWLNLLEKKSLINQYTTLGFPNPADTALTVGLLEIAAALTILIRPTRSVLLVVVLWKMGSELFYPRYELFEWIERGGSYGVLIALWFAAKSVSAGEFANHLLIKNLFGKKIRHNESY